MCKRGAIISECSVSSGVDSGIAEQKVGLTHLEAAEDVGGGDDLKGKARKNKQREIAQSVEIRIGGPRNGACGSLLCTHYVL